MERQTDTASVHALIGKVSENENVSENVPENVSENENEDENDSESKHIYVEMEQNIT